MSQSEQLKSAEMMEYSSDLNIMQLPNEMKAEILRHLSLEEKRCARLVCKLWRDLSDDLLLNFNVSVTKENLKYLRNFSKPLHSVRMGNARKLLALTAVDSAILSEAQALELDNSSVWHPSNSPVNCSENIKLILRTCKNIKDLRISGEFLRSVVLTAPLELHTTKLCNLTSIIINLDDLKDELILRAFAKLKVPKLVCFGFHKKTEVQVLFSFPIAIFTAMFFFIKTNEKTLKILSMYNTIAHFDPSRWNPNPFIDYGQPTFYGVYPLVNLKLESLEINHKVDIVNSQWGLSEAILTNQKSIRNLKIEITHVHLYRKLMELIMQNEELEMIDIDLSVMHFKKNDPKTLDIGYFRSCRKLRELRLCASPHFTAVNALGMPRSVKSLYWSGKLSYEQVTHWATYLRSVEHLILNHVFSRDPSEIQSLNHSPRFDVPLLSLFKDIPSLISLKVSFCDVRTCLFSLNTYCKNQQITITRTCPTTCPQDFPTCYNPVITFTFPRF